MPATPNTNGLGSGLLMLAATLTVLEGAARKWVEMFGAGTPRYLAYFSKDIVFALLLLLPLRALKTPALTLFESWLKAGCVLFLVGAALSSSHGFNTVGSVLTLRAAVVLPAIAFLVVPRLAGVQVRQVAWLLTVLTILNFGLALVQGRLPSDHFLNKYATMMEQVVELESGVRATGTFSYITGLGMMSSIGVWAGLALLSLAQKPWDHFGGYAALACGLGCGLAAVSRGPVLVGTAMVLGWLVFSRAGHRLAGHSLLAGLLITCVAWGGGLFATFSKLGENLMTRNEQAGDTFQDRSFGQLREAGVALKVAPLGRGLGTEQVGGNYAQGGTMIFTNFESQLPRVVMESGFVGLAGFVMVCAGALVALQRARLRASPAESSLLLATQLFLLPMFYTNVIFNHTASAFVWIIFATVLADLKPELPAVAGRERGNKLKPGRAATPWPGTIAASGADGRRSHLTAGLPQAAK